MTKNRGPGTRHLRWARRPGPDEAGFSILEVIVAMALFALIVVAVANSTSTGLKMVQVANSRQVATQVLVQQMEGVRTHDYELLGMDPATDWRREDAGSPDAERINSSETTFQTPEGNTEALVLGADYTLEHLGSDEQNGLDFTVYRYVSWIDDPATTDTAEDYKRVTMIAKWREQVADAELQEAHLSSLVTSQSLEFLTPSTTTPTSTASTVATTTPSTIATTTTTLVGSCTDTTAPVLSSMQILAGPGGSTAYTSTTSIGVSSTGSDTGASGTGCPVLKMELVSGTVTDLRDYSSTVTFDMQGGAGSRTVSVRLYDGFQYSNILTDTITVDLQDPDLTSFSLAEGTGNRVVVTWTTAADPNPNPSGVATYRIERRTGASGAWSTIRSAPAPCSPCNYTDGGTQNNKTYQYRIYVIDNAGNTSDSDNAIQQISL